MKKLEKIISRNKTKSLAELVVARTDDGLYLTVRDKTGELCTQRIAENQKFEVSISGRGGGNKIEAEIWLLKRGEKR